jgi:cytochrome c oxidase subunit 6a
MEKWKKISYLGIPSVSLFCAYCMYQHFAHHHDAHEPIPYPHMKIRTKPFPWGSKDCDLFDFACKRKVYEEATG